MTPLALVAACSRSTPASVEARADASSTMAATPSAADVDAAYVGMGLTVGDIRSGTDFLADAHAGETGGPAMDLCQWLAAEKLVARCRYVGGNDVTYELPDPREGRGVIRWFDSQQRYETVARTAEESQTPHIANPRARLILLGSSGMTDKDRARTRMIVTAAAR